MLLIAKTLVKKQKILAHVTLWITLQPKVLTLPHFSTYPRHVTLAHAVVHVEPVRGDQAGNVGIKGVKVDRVEPVLKK